MEKVVVDAFHELHDKEAIQRQQRPQWRPVRMKHKRWRHQAGSRDTGYVIKTLAPSGSVSICQVAAELAAPPRHVRS